MPWINVIPEHEAGSELKKVYKQIREQRRGEKINQDRDAGPGGPPITPSMPHGLNPKAMWHTAELMWEIMRGESRITTAQREMIATVTCAALHCRFWTVAHAEFLRQEGGDDLSAEQIKDDWRTVELTQAEYSMLEFAEKLTLTPSNMREDDVQKLRNVGWTDRDILDIVHVCAYFNFRVRVVDGLGLEVADWQIERARAGAQRAARLAEERGVAMPSDPWKVR
jgi:uncharacterized peroxidase-related enzyme